MRTAKKKVRFAKKPDQKKRGSTGGQRRESSVENGRKKGSVNARCPNGQGVGTKSLLNTQKKKKKTGEEGTERGGAALGLDSLSWWADAQAERKMIERRGGKKSAALRETGERNAARKAKLKTENAKTGKYPHKKKSRKVEENGLFTPHGREGGGDCENKCERPGKKKAQNNPDVATAKPGPAQNGGMRDTQKGWVEKT